MNSDDVAALHDMPLHAMVGRLVRSNIESGRLPPGTPLTEYGLALELSLSRVPVGRALQRLAEDAAFRELGLRAEAAASILECDRAVNAELDRYLSP